MARLIMNYLCRMAILLAWLSCVTAEPTTANPSDSLLVSDNAFSRLSTWLDANWIEVTALAVALPLTLYYSSWLTRRRLVAYMPIIAPLAISSGFSYLACYFEREPLKDTLSLGVVNHIYQLTCFVLLLALTDYALLVRQSHLQTGPDRVKSMGLFVLLVEYLYVAYYGGQLFFRVMFIYSTLFSAVPYTPIKYFLVGTVCSVVAVFAFRLWIPSHAERFIYVTPIFTAFVYHVVMYMLSFIA